MDHQGNLDDNVNNLAFKKSPAGVDSGSAVGDNVYWSIDVDIQVDARVGKGPEQSRLEGLL